MQPFRFKLIKIKYLETSEIRFPWFEIPATHLQVSEVENSNKFTNLRYLIFIWHEWMNEFVTIYGH
jgi:hypothetical protein